MRGAAVSVLTRSVSLTDVLPDRPGSARVSGFTHSPGRYAGRFVGQRIAGSVRPDRQGRRSLRRSRRRPLGSETGSEGQLYRGPGSSSHADDARIAVAPPRVDPAVSGGNNHPVTAPARPVGVTRPRPGPPPCRPAVAATVNPCASRPAGQRAVRGSSATTVGPAPEITAGTPSRPEGVDQSGGLRIGRAPVALVQPVLGSRQQQFGASGEGQDGERRAAPGERRVDQRDPVGQKPAGGGWRTRRPRRAPPGRSPGARRAVQRQTGPLYSRLSQATTNPPSRLAAALSAWPSIPAVSCSNVSPLLLRSRPASAAAATAPATAAAAELPSPRRAGSRCGNAPQPGRRVAENVQDPCASPARPGAASSRGTRPGTLALDLDGQRRRRDRDLDLVVEPEREPEGVEAGPEVGRRAPGPGPGPRFGRPITADPARPPRRPGRSGPPSARRGEQRGVGVLEAVPGDRAHHQRPARQRTVPGRLQQPRHARRRRRLDEHRLARREQPVRREDLVVGDRGELPAGLVTGRDRRRHDAGAPIRMAVAMVSGWLHRRAVHQRGRARGLEAEHPRRGGDQPVGA